MRASDVFAFPAVGEGFPLVLQEAMASGLPALLAPDPTYDGVINDDLCAFADPSPVAVRTGLAALIADPARRMTMGRAAREFAERHFDWDANIYRHLALFAELCARGRKPTPRASGGYGRQTATIVS
jgi:glycosyltransferase involved in cell wall biosynthesis